MVDETLFRKIKSAIADNPDKVIQFEGIWKDYDGSKRLLDIFCERFGSYDPWEATSNAELKSAIFRTDRELEEIGGRYGRKGKSESGHFLTNQLYMFADKIDPTVTWVSGAQAITKIMQAFGTYDQKKVLTPEGRTEIKVKKRSQARKTSKDFVSSLEEVLKDPALLSDIQSTLDKQKIKYILGVDETLADRLNKLDNVIYGNTALVDEKSKNYLLAMDPGGQFYSWFNRQLSTLPHRIRDIYTTLRDMSVELPEEKRKKYFGALVAYAACHTPIDKDVAIGGYLKDLELLLNIPEDDPIIEKFGKIDLKGIRDILEKKGDITLIEAVKVFDVYPVEKVRNEINLSVYGTYKKDVDYAVYKLESIFIEDGKWKDDCLSGSVPMSRLRDTKYGDIFVHDDWKQIMTYFRLRTLAPESHFFKGMAMADFRDMIEGIAKTARRTRQYENNDDVIFIGSDYQLKEKFPFNEGKSSDETPGFVFDEMCRRLEAVFPENSLWMKNKDRLLKENEAGLYRSMRSTERLAKLAHTVVPAKEINMEDLNYVLSHPLVRKVFMKLDPNKEYFTKEEAKNLEKIALARNEVEEKEYSKTLFEKLDTTKHCYVGRIGWEVSINRVGYVNSTSSTSRIGGEMVKVGDTEYLVGGLEVINPQQLETELDNFLKDFKKPSEIWYERLFTLIEMFGIKGNNGQIDELVTDGYMDKNFIDNIDNYYDSLDLFESQSRDELIKGDDSYQLKITGTTIADKGRFLNEFKEFGYQSDEQVWTTRRRNSRRLFRKKEILNIGCRIKQYNEKYNTDLKVHLM